MSVPAISLEGITREVRGDPVLKEVSLAAGAGEVVALLGPSGAGKTTLLRVVLGFAVPAAGTVSLDGEIVQQGRKTLRPPEERRLGVVFQDLALWPHLTVHGNLAFATGAAGLSREAGEIRIAELLERLGLRGKARRYPGELSGGERQRVALARALAQDPRAVLLDEPLANLDAPLRRDLLRLLREVLRERRLTALYVTHELREAEALGARLAVLEGGRLTQVGSIDELRAAPATPFIQALMESAAQP